MGPVWEVERVVDVGVARAAVAAHFPQLAHLPVRPLATGWDNAVFLVGDDVVFRFVHRRIAAPLAAREVAVLRRLSGRLPLRVPTPLHVPEPLRPTTPPTTAPATPPTTAPATPPTTPSAEVDHLQRGRTLEGSTSLQKFDLTGTGNGAGAGEEWPFWGGPLVPGVELARAGLAEEDRVPVAARLGGFLRALHDPALAAEVAAGAADDGVALPVDPMRRADPATSAERARPVLGRLAAAGAHVPVDALEDLLVRAVDVGPPGGDPVLTHGDLHVRHVLVADGDAAGVIDWGDTCLGWPSTDLAIAYAAFAGTARRAFLDAYGDVDDATALRARATAVRIVAALLEQVLADGDSAVVVEAKAALHRVLAP